MSLDERTEMVTGADGLRAGDRHRARTPTAGVTIISRTAATLGSVAAEIAGESGHVVAVQGDVNKGAWPTRVHRKGCGFRRDGHPDQQCAVSKPDITTAALTDVDVGFLTGALLPDGGRLLVA